MVGWHHWHNGHESEQAPGDDERQGSLVCCSPWGSKESDTTEWLNKKEPAYYCRCCGWSVYPQLTRLTNHERHGKPRMCGSHLTLSPGIWYELMAAAAAAKSLQSCPTLCDPTDGSPPGSPVPGILQARTLEWVAISFSNARKWKVKVKLLSRVQLLATPWTAAYQAPPSMGFASQEYWSGVPLPF